MCCLCAAWCRVCRRWSPRRAVGWASWPSPTTCGPPSSRWWSASCSSSSSNPAWGRRWRVTGWEGGPSWPRPTPCSTSSGERGQRWIFRVKPGSLWVQDSLCQGFRSWPAEWQMLVLVLDIFSCSSDNMLPSNETCECRFLLLHQLQLMADMNTFWGNKSAKNKQQIVTRWRPLMNSQSSKAGLPEVSRAGWPVDLNLFSLQVKP